MKFVVEKNILNELLTKIQNVVPQKPAMPLLSNIMIEAINDELILTCTDLNVGMRCFAEVKIAEEGATTVPARRFIQLIKELTHHSLEISTDANEITTIIAGSSKFKLHGMSKNQYPALPDMTGATHFKIGQKDLKEMLFRTSFAVSREDNRYVLTGVLMKIANSCAIFAGTDGKRLSRAYLPLQIDQSFAGDYVIPFKAIEEIVKNLSDEGEAILYIMPDKIGVQANNAMVVTKLLTGEYPDVSRVIPEETGNIATIHREELITLLRQISLFVVDGSHSVRFSFMPGELQISANSSDIGEGTVTMPVNYQGEQLDIAFNPGFFLDILRHSKEEIVTMGLIDSYNPAVITDIESSQPTKNNSNSTTPLFVLMPMRLDKE